MMTVFPYCLNSSSLEGLDDPELDPRLYQNRAVLAQYSINQLNPLKPNGLIIINVYQNNIINTVLIDEF